MQPITTKLTRLLNISSPIIQAPMGMASSPALVAAVTKSGGLGFAGAAFDSSQKIKQTIQSIRDELKIPKGVQVPMGIGLIGWILESTETSDDPRIGAVLDELPQAIWFAFGVDLGKYVKQVHEHDAKRGRKTLIFVIVNTVEEAVRAAHEWKVDVIVAQGIEAGGHGGGYAPPIFLLLPAILAAIPDGPPIIAAGGIATGSQIAALLTLGASGVALGTRFLFTHESGYSQAKKDVLISAKLTDTARSLAFDEVNRTMGWPEGCDGRAIANNIMKDFEAGFSLKERMELFDESTAQGDRSRLVVWAGMGSGLTDKISHTSDVFNELHKETYECLNRASSLL